MSDFDWGAELYRRLKDCGQDQYFQEPERVQHDAAYLIRTNDGCCFDGPFLEVFDGLPLEIISVYRTGTLDMALEFRPTEGAVPPKEENVADALIAAAKKAHADDMAEQEKQAKEQAVKREAEAKDLMRDMVRLMLGNYAPHLKLEPVFGTYDTSIYGQLVADFTLDGLSFRAVRWSEGKDLQLLIEGEGYDIGDLSDLGRLIEKHGLDRESA